MKTLSLKTTLSKTALPLLFAATTLTSTNTLAHDDPQKHCYPLAHGEEGLGSTNSIYMPFIHTRGSSWASRIYLTNTSNKNLNVKFTLRTEDGATYTPTQYSVSGSFSPTNSPLDDASGGAILAPFKSGHIHIHEDAYQGIFTGKITWQADACLESAMTGALRIEYVNSDRYDQGLVVLNGGNPF